MPIDTLETEQGFCGYIEPVIPDTFSDYLICFAEFINEHQYDITLEQISDYILKCADIAVNCHNNGIVNPDMASKGNVLYNWKSGLVYFTDFQDMQVHGIPSDVISSFIAPELMIYGTKYQIGNMCTPNIDWYTLAVRFFYYATKINLPRAIKFYSLEEILKCSGISSTYFADCLRILYDLNRNNIDIREPVKELCREYRLTPFRAGQVRMLVKK